MSDATPLEKPAGHLHLGEELHDGERSGTPILLDSADLTTHGVIVGMTGSGKTGLGVVLLEEALLAGIPVLALDPKGDLGNLALTFGDLDAASFEPWMDAGTARVEGTDVAGLAETTAERWTKGLAGWGLEGDDVAHLGYAASPVIYTPGSDAGIPLDVLGKLTVPAVDDPQDEIDATVAGLLQLVGVDSDPLSGREHILLANLIARSWNDGIDLDMPTLLGQILDPPIRKLGVLDLETFYPAADRQKLVMKLNGLLASPSFAAWAEGAPLDIASMLWDGAGNARAAVVSMSHLDDSERQFTVTMVLSKLISWMRTQPGTSQLRVLVYMDEVMGLVPPVGNPPAKGPILTLLKQARAFGVGLVLATQNPVDVDYKALSNAGTWMIGRLQTEQDKNRLVDGLRSADGSTDLAQVEATISALGKREFMLRTTRSSDLPRFTTRWAMSYLAGPLTRDQISTLMDPKREALLAGGAIAGTGSTAGPVSSEPELADDESTLAPTLPDGLGSKFVHPSAPWARELGLTVNGRRHVPYIAARVNLLFDETKAKLRENVEWEALIPFGSNGPDLDELVEVDYDDRDLVDEPTSADVAYVIDGVDLTKTDLTTLQRELKARLHRTEMLTLQVNPELKLYSRPGEAADTFAARCDAAASDAADAEAEKLRAKLETKTERVQAALAKAEDRVEELEVQTKGREREQWLRVGGSVLGGLLGSRRSARGLASAARGVASGQRQKAAAETRLESAKNRVMEKIDELEDLELELGEALIEIDDEWTEKATAIESFEVPLEKTDITVDDLCVVWVSTDG